MHGVQAWTMSDCNTMHGQKEWESRTATQSVTASALWLRVSTRVQTEECHLRLRTGCADGICMGHRASSHESRHAVLPL
jgi:hypothetical protein